MYFHIVGGTESYTTSTTNMYNKYRFHVRVSVVALKHNFRQRVSVVHGGRSAGGATAAFQRQAGGGRGCVGMRFDFRVARHLKKIFFGKKKRTS